MGIRVDFLNYLDPDMSMKILMCLEDVSDLARICAVSRSWRHFVVANGLWKSLCFRMFPQLSKVGSIIESCGVEKAVEVESSRRLEREVLEKEHRVYSFLARGLTSFAIGRCISDAIGASSTDYFPRESIYNTLDSRDKIGGSYWSSKGQKNPEIPESLTYKLVSSICVITEIGINPFERYIGEDSLIYSAKSVRFRLGHSKIHINDLMGQSRQDFVDDQFVWTYTSQEFPMAQENSLQNFKLPQPALCIGGILQIELLGRVQKDIDDLFYVCVSHVQVKGRSLSPAFDVEILKPSGEFALKALSYTQPNPPEDDPATTSHSANLLRCVRDWRRVRDLEQMLNLFPGHVGIPEHYEWEEEGVESDDEFDPALIDHM